MRGEVKPGSGRGKEVKLVGRKRNINPGGRRTRSNP